MTNRSSLVGVVFAAVFILGANLFGALLASTPQASDGRSLRWDRFDVTIDQINTAANRFNVTETYALTIETGPFSFGYADIPLDRLTGISGVTVLDGQTALRESCLGGPGTFCITTDQDFYSIKYYFLRLAQSGQPRTIQIKYTVTGALRSYSDGDQLYWVAVPGDRDFPVLASTVTVIMPDDRPPEVTASYPDTWRETVRGNTITWEAPGSLGKDGSVEVRVQYPHDPRMTKPSWQAGYDRERFYVDNIRPFVSLILGAGTVLVTLGGVLLIVVRYLTHGRDPQALAVPEYLDAPPSDELPGVVGLLLDERADMKDILGTLLDLARRGYLAIEQTEASMGPFGMFGGSDFTFHRTDKDLTDLVKYERTLLNGLFPRDRRETPLSALRTKFYTFIPAIKKGMYQELVARGYFTRSPDTTRNLWMVGGIGAMVLASGLFWLVRSLTLISPLIIAPPIGLGIVGLAAALAAWSMPAKTPKGAQDAARWRAFRRYLQNIEQYSDLSQVADRFEQYIGYAVVFGIEKEWVRRFSPVLTSVPGWYQPTHLGGPWRGGYLDRRAAAGHGAPLGDLGLDRPGGLTDMSRSLTEGLNAMSSGLTRMLNDASSAMTSRPKSSGSGRGFSGGGRGFGGGSGGGRRGFG